MKVYIQKNGITHHIAVVSGNTKKWLVSQRFIMQSLDGYWVYKVSEKVRPITVLNAILNTQRKEYK